MQTITGLVFSSDQKLIAKVSELNIIHYSNLQSAFVAGKYFLQFIDYSYYLNNKKLFDIALLEKLNAQPKSSVFLLVENDDTSVNIDDYSDLGFPSTLKKTDLMNNQLVNIVQNYQQHKQNRDLVLVSDELNSEYEKIKIELQEKLFSQEKKIKDSRLKILELNKRNEILNRILFALFNETDFLRIESILNEYVPKALDLAWVKIIPNKDIENLTNDLNSKLNVSFYTLSVGTQCVFFIRSYTKKFKKSEIDFFQKIADSIYFVLERGEQLKKLALFEEILSMTFKSFPQPLAIVDRQYNVIESNQNFDEKIKHEKCYSVLFKRDTPCDGCQLGNTFRIQFTKNDFTVTSHALTKTIEEKQMFLNSYEDQFERQLMEKKINENQQIQTLGLVASSLAHELSNPFGGVYSFLQLIALEHSKNLNLQQDIAAMLTTSQRIKTILENLQSFARRPDLSHLKSVFIDDLFLNSVAQNDTLLKSKKIQVSIQQMLKNQNVLCSQESMQMTFNLIFNFFVQEFESDSQIKNQKIKIIEIKSSLEDGLFHLDLNSNSNRTQISESLRMMRFLSVQKLLIDQGFRAELTSPFQDWLGLRLSFSVIK